MAYKLDPSKALVRILSNDAFFWLFAEEEPLDEENLEEAEEIQALFPNGFIIQEGWTYEDEDSIKATFIPYVLDNVSDWDGENRDNDKNAVSFKFRILAFNKCYVRWVNENTGKLIYEGECEVKYIASNPWAYTPNRSFIPLWGPKCLYFTNKRFTYNKEASECIMAK